MAAGRCYKRWLLSSRSLFQGHKSTVGLFIRRSRHTTQYSSVDQLPKGPDFGLFFDIDGVIVRGRTILPHAREAFRLLTDRNGKFWVPTIFVTNAGNCLRQDKSKQLSEWLGIEVMEDQVILSHSPLKMFRQLLDKHVLVSGQGPTTEIAKHLGFKRITTIETLRKRFPKLDTMDYKRKLSAPCAFENYFPRIEAVIMFGEPVRWEMNLQLIMDVLLTDGKPSVAAEEIPYPHIPVLACGVDLMWMAEAPMPRFGHGAFLHCVESLYKKITGYDLKYTALVGKPSEITYIHSENVLQTLARNMGLPGLRRMYCIGDNPDVDIYGANLFNRYLQKKLIKCAASKVPKTVLRQGAEIIEHDDERSEEGHNCEMAESTEHIGAYSCASVLVATGVYQNNSRRSLRQDHVHRDFIMDPELRKPTMEVNDVLEAVQFVFENESMIT